MSIAPPYARCTQAGTLLALPPLRPALGPMPAPEARQGLGPRPALGLGIVSGEQRAGVLISSDKRASGTMPDRGEPSLSASAERTATTAPPSPDSEDFHAIPPAPTPPENEQALPAGAAGRTAPAPKRAAPTGPATAPRAGRNTTPYREFCLEQRPLLMPLRMTNRDREKLLGVLAPYL